MSAKIRFTFNHKNEDGNSETNARIIAEALQLSHRDRNLIEQRRHANIDIECDPIMFIKWLKAREELGFTNRIKCLNLRIIPENPVMGADWDPRITAQQTPLIKAP